MEEKERKREGERNRKGKNKKTQPPLSLSLPPLGKKKKKKRFRSAEGRALVGATSDSDVVLTYVGRLGAEKNLGVLVDLLAALPAKARLSLVGDGPARAELERAFAADPRGLASRVTFTGMLRGEQLASAYASADVFVMPSETETLGFVALEAMASRLPAVCVAAGGLVDIVTRDGEIGFLYPADDYEALFKIVSRLVDSSEERERVGAQARRHVESMGWLPSVRSVREGPYSRAISRFGVRVLERRLWRRAALSRVAALACALALAFFVALAWGGQPAEVAAEALRRAKGVLPFGLGGVAV
jgi:glycosyltransferase involved in cell wall biosynthesis